MARELPNQYSMSNLPGIDPHVRRVMQDMTDRINYLTGELDQVRSVAMSASPGIDAARKENPAEGVIAIPGQGSPGFIRVSQDGVIKGYGAFPNLSANGQIIGVPYTITSRNDVVPTVGAALTVLHAVTIPPNSLASNKDFLEIIQNGTFANNTNTKRVTAAFDIITVEDTGLKDFRGGLCWQLYTLVTRVSSVLVHIIFSGWFQLVEADSVPVVSGGFGGRFITRGSASATVNNLNTTAVSITISGQGTSNADVNQTFTAVKLTRMS